MDDDDTMSGAELRVVLDWLGINQQALSRILDVDERTVRRWVLGTSRVPEGVREEVEAIEAATATAVGEIVTALHDARDPVLMIYRHDEDLWAARPSFKPYPAGWWRMICARSVHEVPGVQIVYAAPEDVEEADLGVTLVSAPNDASATS